MIAVSPLSSPSLPLPLNNNYGQGGSRGVGEKIEQRIKRNAQKCLGLGGLPPVCNYYLYIYINIKDQKTFLVARNMK